MILLNAISVVLYIASGLYILHRFKKVFILYVLYFGLQAWALVSCFYNDLGVYNPELFRYTETSLATTRLAIFYLVFNVGFLIVGCLINNRPLTRRDWLISRQTINLGNLKLIVYGLVALLIVYEGYSFWAYGIPVLQGMDRWTFLQESGPLEWFLVGYGYILAFLLGYFRKKRKWISLNGAVIVLFVLYLLATGHKYSALVGIIIPYYTPIFVRYLAKRPWVNLLRIRNLVCFATIVSVVLCYSFITYRYRSESDAAAEYFLTNRLLANQGEIWWAVDYDYFTFDTYDPRHWQDELDHILSPAHTPIEDVGMRYLMVQILGPEKAYMVFDHGYLYTMAYPAILIMTFPYAVAIGLQLVAGMFFFALLYYLYYCVLYRHIVRAVLTILILWPFMSVMAAGNFVVLCTIGVAVKIALLLVVELGILRTNRVEAHL